MRCRTHPSDSGVGVCATCLRERLSNLAAPPAGKNDLTSPEVRRKPNNSSVPSILFRLSSFTNDIGNNNRDSGKISTSYPIRSNPTLQKSESDTNFSDPSGSNSCLLGIGSLGRKKGNKKTSPHVQTVNCKGMSPATEEEPETVEGGHAKKPSPGRCISTPSPMRRQPSPRSFSSFGRCLSPLVWPSPGTHRGHSTPMTAFPGKFSETFNRRCNGRVNTGVTDGSSGLVANRSRKLVDLGKIW